MRKIIRLITQTIKPKPNNKFDRLEREAIREERASDREWRKLAVLKRSAILSYISTVVRRDTLEEIRYQSKYDLIAYIISTGRADDCIREFKTY